MDLILNLSHLIKLQINKFFQIYLKAFFTFTKLSPEIITSNSEFIVKTLKK